MNATKKIPEAVLAATAGMLAPFGVTLEDFFNEGKKSPEQDSARYLSIADVEARYGLKRWTLYRLIKAGKINAAKLSQARAGKVLVEASSVERFLRVSKYKRKVA